MKRFIVILLVLILVPLYCLANGLPSPTGGKLMPVSDPEIPFEIVDNLDEWPTIVERIHAIEDELQGFVMIDAVKVQIDKHYDIVNWKLTIPITSDHEPFMLVIDSEAINKYDIGITEDGQLVTDLSEFDIGTYYLCFYIKVGVN